MELFSLFELELQFIEIKLINTKTNELQENFKQYLQTNKKNMEADYSYMGFRGYDFKDSYLDVYKDMQNYFENVNNEIEKNSIAPEMKKNYNDLPKSMNLFLNHIQLTGNISTYNSYPILSMIDLNDFFKKISSLTFEDQRIVFLAFNERYEKTYSNGTLKREYYADIDSVKVITDLYKASIDDTVLKPSNIRKHYLANAYEELYKWMVEQKKVKEGNL